MFDESTDSTKKVPKLPELSTFGSTKAIPFVCVDLNKIEWVFKGYLQEEDAMIIFN